MKHAYFLIFIVQLVSAFPSMPIQSGERPTKTEELFCNNLHECSEMDPNMHCLYETCQCKDGYTWKWNLNSCDQNSYQHRYSTKEIVAVVGTISLVILIAISVLAFVMTFCGYPTDKIHYYSMNIQTFNSMQHSTSI